ncbi:hypothetical protein [Desulfonema magnum]|uniref:Uncharacterized protein n=1 Tax=Desulfonema magnum TaxID=45655 RepID=A0A975BRL1_9BACT|nr:hypothetical protein [Desulfonema magnum]QTA90152.1 Uncharacterized protein dnm_062130 [Desulfonema magnum]
MPSALIILKLSEVNWHCLKICLPKELEINNIPDAGRGAGVAKSVLCGYADVMFGGFCFAAFALHFGYFIFWKILCSHTPYRQEMILSEVLKLFFRAIMKDDFHTPSEQAI